MTSSFFYNNELTEIIERFYKKVKHPYLNKYIKDPYVDEDQAALLYLMLKQKKFDLTYISDCIVTTILVQSALDTHEQVGSGQTLVEGSKKKRQLTVLAGDFYSSLYYFVLSKINDVPLIRVLAKSIQEINESKMNIYKHEDRDLKASFDDVRLIDSSLLQNIASLLQMPEWKKLIEEFFFFKRLLKERFMYVHTGVKGSIIEIMLREQGVDLDNEAALLHRFDSHINMSKEKLIATSQE